MSFKLKSRTQEFPPSGFMFTDSKTGMKFSEGDFKDVVSQIIKHRQANPRIYPPSEIASFDFASVANELDATTCSRLNDNPRFCESGEPIPVSTDGMELMLMSRACVCGSKMGYQALCASCSGRRVLHYICSECKSLVQK